MRKPRINVRVVLLTGIAWVYEKEKKHRAWLVEDDTGRRAFVRKTQIEGTGSATVFSVPADSFDN